MPIHKSVHPQYAENISNWEKCEDAFDGQDAVHAGGQKYLPKLGGQSNEEYKAYKLRALFYSITSKSVMGMVGLAITKPPVLKHPARMDSYFVEDSGLEFYELYTDSLIEVLLQGRYGVFVDMPVAGGRPVAATYDAECIVNWGVNSLGELEFVVLKEETYVPSKDDKYELVEQEQYRELRMVNGQFEVNLFNEKGEKIGSTLYPNIMGRPMTFIPFFIVGPSGLNVEVEKSPVLDIVDINLSHYRTSADLEHGRHFTSLPTPVVMGVDASSKLHIGSKTAWVLPMGGDAKYLEFTGQGLLSLEKAMVEKQSQLASLSSRLLDNSGRGSEAADTVRIRHLSETANLSSIVRSIEALLNKVYKTAAMMMGLDPVEVSVQLQKEFVDNRVSPAELKELTATYLAGLISKEMFVYNLRRGEMYSPTRTDAEEIAAITAVTTTVPANPTVPVAP